MPGELDPLLAAPLIVGFGVTGAAVAGALVRRGAAVRAVDDHVTDAMRRRAGAVGVALDPAPDATGWPALLADRTCMLPTPGLAERHPAMAAASSAGVPVLSEFDLAARWDDRPLLAVTGTNGKTTVTTLITAMLRASGVRAEAVGNTETPLVAAIDDPATEVFVVEASSFRLGHTRRFSPLVATWLNFAPDHLDVHASLHSYEAAKAVIFRDLDPARATAVVNVDDPVVMRHVPTGVTTRTFAGPPSVERAAHGGSVDADYAVRDGVLVGPGGDELVRADELFRSLPHDVSNTLAAAATALAGGASPSGVRQGARSFRGLAHRVALVARHGGVSWYDDSKATTPDATLAALGGFDSVVLIAGGRNKGLDLSVLADAAPRLRAVVALGEAADEIAAAFEGRCPLVRATSMADAVARAADAASAGDVVLLSPGCASFDMFESYAQRGDAFADEVRRVVGAPTPTPPRSPDRIDPDPTDPDPADPTDQPPPEEEDHEP